MKQTLYSKNDLSSLLKLSVSTIDNKMGAGELRYYKIGKSVRFDDDMITEFLSGQTQKKYKQKHLLTSIVILILVRWVMLSV